MSTREEAIVHSVFYGREDHGILTCYLHMGGDGWGQAFGGICLDEKTGPDFRDSVCSFFGVRTLDEIKGKRCIVLRCFQKWNEPIEGLELASGERFTLTAWRSKHWPDTLNPLEKRKKSLDDSIASDRRRISELMDELSRVDEEYAPW